MRAYKILSFSVAILLITVVFAGAVTVPAAAQYDTMQYRYNAAHTGDYSPVAGPVPSNGKLLWNYTTGGYVYSSPAVANGVVYVGSEDGNLYALNATTGVKLWNYTAGAGSYVQSSPAVANGVVYTGDGNENLYALNATTGVKLWNYTTQGAIQQSSPAVANGVVYIGSNDGDVYAIYANNGTLLWRFISAAGYPDAIISSPAVANGVVYFQNVAGGTYAVDALTGVQKWVVSLGGWAWLSAAIANGLVYIGSGYPDNNFYALNATNGETVWRAPVAVGSYWADPAVANGVVYIGSNDNNTYALNAINGAKLWNYTTRGEVHSSPAVANGVVYIGSNDNNTYALNAINGAKLWNYTTGGEVYSSPAIVNGVVYVGSSDGKVYAIGTESVSKQTALTISAPSFAAINKPFTINGTLNTAVGIPVAGATIQLQKNVSGTWTHVAVKANTTTSTGAYSISTSEPTTGTYQYRTIYAGNATYTNTTSNVVKVSVIAPATAGSLLLNTHLVSTTTGSPPRIVTTYTFSGQLMTTSWAPIANAAITFQSSADKVHWSAFASPVKTNAQGAYTFKGTLKPGSYYFRTFFAGTSSTGPTASRIVKVVISLNGSSSVSTVVA
jgi:outer membrane protein assembly factor BamB